MFYYGIMLDEKMRKIGEHKCCRICYDSSDMCNMFETTTRCLKVCNNILYFQFENEDALDECVANDGLEKLKNKNGLMMRFSFS